MPVDLCKVSIIIIVLTNSRVSVVQHKQRSNAPPFVFSLLRARVAEFTVDERAVYPVCMYGICLVILLYKVNTAIQYIPMTNISESLVFLNFFKKGFSVIFRKSCPIRTCTLFGYE